MDDPEQSPLENDELSEYDIYSKTPPRTKILRKNRERKNRDRQASTPVTIVKAKAPIVRRNTTGAFYDDIFSKDENTDDEFLGNKRVNKRQMKLLRGSERDLKLDIARAQAASAEFYNKDDSTNDFPPKTPSYQIESTNRFMSLVGRTFPCKKICPLKRVIGKKVDEKKKEDDQKKFEALKLLGYDKRVEFYHIMKSLIKMGEKAVLSDNAKRLMTREETLWQNELKDLIWLELQAYHADRTPMEEDTYLCLARECVEPLLKDIMNYRFHRPSRKDASCNSDSGVEEDCPGCASILCYSCMEAQNEALKEVEKLLKRLEDAESLFPSSNAFAELYPLYRSPEIVGRVRVMCQWYNVTKHQRLKLNLLGRLVVLLESKHSDWPCFAVGEENGSVSPSDSNNSTSSSGSNTEPCSDMYNITPVTIFLAQRDSTKVSPYRRYIENILKTRALDKSLNFLEKIHKRVLQKTKKTLELPEDQSIFSKLKVFDDEELCRYGCWSPEYAALDLPSYRGLFIFLATVPLDVYHEYLLMRLEQKPTNPSALSTRQLMRELKQGLKKAMRERDLACHYIESATAGTLITCPDFKEKLLKFEDCIQKVFIDYLHYLKQWMIIQTNFQKTMLEDEYAFAMNLCEIFPHLKRTVGSEYTCILGTILAKTGERMIFRINSALELLSQKDVDVKQNLFSVCRQLQSVFIEEKETSIKTISFLRMHLRRDIVTHECILYMKERKEVLVIQERNEVLDDAITIFQSIIPNGVQNIHSLFDTVSSANLDEVDKNALNSRIRELLMRVFTFGFEFYKELNDLSAEEYRPSLVVQMGHFADLWMKFVTERCDKGRGIRPKWAFQGMDYLLSIIEPINSILLTEEQFEELKISMDSCISHLVGKPYANCSLNAILCGALGISAPSTPDSGFHSASPRNSLEQMRVRSRGSSPSPRPTYKSQRSGQGSRKVSVEQQSPGVDGVDSTPISSPILANENARKDDDRNGSAASSIRIEFSSNSHAEKFREAIAALEAELDQNLAEQNLIGKVLEDTTSNKSSIMRRNVSFSWQRGIKVGQGRFGKVYTAVNNNTGDLMAVKEIALQHNDPGTLRKIAEEMKILEGIAHNNLVKSYGVEVHKDEMLIFMEYCSEGTLECLVADTEGGLPELQARKYTFQLLSGVACLHDHSIVHRDIKTANIFLTEGGNCLKIGDFGCAAKIKSNVTMPGELKGFVGTQAYMAPEVFTKNMSEGHGRAADIWSVGCVVIEMVSGQRPWAQFDSNVQIMFRVGMGQSPDPPDDMTDEGLDFLDLCFKHNPRERATARQLLVHDYVQLKLSLED
ncbi:mitogen-activated protein kinase kinase kinase 4 isoform X1 [Diabrotica virgifera virgifera]|uniref:Protein kinase domain-containing protein n=2 Tax=Diabrotica virgifera virgifera TaxID=50390 RepID=A0ABM5JRT5_DIAVI|nr:mitogen-activated protein kinase kinase kinase 4 isoform X1 [Diabrotica virgifera virgifera]